MITHKVSDRLLTYFLFFILTMLNVAVVVGNNDAKKNAKIAAVAAVDAKIAAQLVATNLENSTTCK